MPSTKPILIIYPYFLPAQKAGGIVTSLKNLIDRFKGQPIYIFTSCYDLDGSLLVGIETNCWVSFNNNCSVFYADKNFKPSYRDIVTTFKIRVVYINGIYGYKYVFKPILELNLVENIILIVAPRGMVQKSSLQQKWLKKWLYLLLINKFNLFKSVCFHALNEKEASDIRNSFKCKNKIVVASDFTSIPTLSKTHKSLDNPIRFISLSLITEIKNVSFLVNIFKQLPANQFILDIYGPIVDSVYWERVKSNMINSQNIKYLGSVNPNDVASLLRDYNFILLPSKGDAFGHVIFESLVAETPVIISDKTSWQNIEANVVGWVIPLEEKLWIERLKSISTISDDEYAKMSSNCHRYIDKYLTENNSIKDYEALFASTKSVTK